MLAPLIVNLIDSYGWRDSSIMFAVGMLIIVLPLSLLIRHRPEPYGYFPDGKDGKSPAENPTLQELPVSEVNMTLKQAVSTRAFWQMTLAYIVINIFILAVFVHVLPYLGSIGIERSIAGTMVMLVSVFAVTSRIGFGFAYDRFNKRVLTLAPFALIIITSLCLAYGSASTIGLVILGMILFGISFGCNMVLRVLQIKLIFGRKRFSSILGLSSGIGIFTGTAGPPLAGWVFDNWQSYQNAWLIIAGLGVISVISMASIPKQVKPV
jgi:cyanate permease